MASLELMPYGEKAYKFIFTPIQEHSRITILSGSVRSSKTWSMIPKILDLCGPDAPQGGLKLFTGASKDSVYDNVLRDLFEIIGAKAYRFNRQNGDLRLFDSSWKVMGAKDEGSEKYLLGKTVAAAYADEITTMPESFFRQLLNRMSPKGARLFATTNPDSPHHYLYRDFIANDKINENGSHLVNTIHFNLNDNPNIGEEYKQSIREAHSGVFYLRYVEGLWVVAEGVVYRDCFSEEENRFGDEDVTSGFYVNYPIRYIAVDVGSVNPQVYLEILDDGRVLWVVREYYWDPQKEKRQKTDREYADDLEKFIGPRRDCMLVMDPSAESFSLECRSRGLMVRDANNEVLQGIRRVSTLFQRRMIRIHKVNCPNLLRERGLYCWDKKSGLEGREQPLKECDHGLDGLRYVCNTVIPSYRFVF